MDKEVILSMISVIYSYKKYVISSRRSTSEQKENEEFGFYVSKMNSIYYFVLAIMHM